MAIKQNRFNGGTTMTFFFGIGNLATDRIFENFAKSFIIDDFGSSAFSLANWDQSRYLLENASYSSIDQSRDDLPNFRVR